MFLLNIKNTGFKISNILVTQDTVKLISLHTDYTVIDFASVLLTMYTLFCFSAFITTHKQMLLIYFIYIFFSKLEYPFKNKYFNTIS